MNSIVIDYYYTEAKIKFKMLFCNQKTVLNDILKISDIEILMRLRFGVF